MVSDHRDEGRARDIAESLGIGLVSRVQAVLYLKCAKLTEARPGVELSR